MYEYAEGFLTQLLQMVLDVLPTSPFQYYIQSVRNIPYLSWLNWFVPVGQMIAIGQAWLVSVGLFYVYSIALRWIKAIE